MAVHTCVLFKNELEGKSEGVFLLTESAPGVLIFTCAAFYRKTAELRSNDAGPIVDLNDQFNPSLIYSRGWG